MVEQRDLILGEALDKAIAHFKVTERTIYRWRQILSLAKKAG
jgi:hypothetical protein